MKNPMEIRGDLWEDQVVRLSKQVMRLVNENEDMKLRVDYLENVVITLLSALKEAGVIVSSDDGTYSFDKE